MIEGAQGESKPIRTGADGEGLRVRIVASGYNYEIVSGLIEGAREELISRNVKPEDIELVIVPGAFEIPLALEVGYRGFDAQVALGCVIRGETGHFDLVVGQCGAGVREAMQRLGMPIGFGVLAVDNVEQARARSGSENNRGKEAALAAVEFAALLNRIR